jgi:hypothetical protein
LADITRGVESDLHMHVQSLNHLARAAGKKLGGLEPQIDRLGERLNALEGLISGDLVQTAEVISSPFLYTRMLQALLTQKGRVRQSI